MIKALLLFPFLALRALPLKIITIILGPPMVALALLCKAYYRTTNKFGGNNGKPIYVFSWKIMAPWQNYTDGFYCTTYYDYGFFWTSMHWSCVRNSAAGLRWFKWYVVPIEPKDISVVAGSYDTSLPNVMQYKNNSYPHFWFLNQGNYLSLMVQGKFIKFKWPFWGLVRFWTGWKITPKDALGVAPDDYRADGAAFVLQYKPVRDG